MIEGDAGAESVYLWTKDKKGVIRRGAGREARRQGLGVHICTGPVLRARRRAGRRPRGAHRRRDAAALRQSEIQRPRLRQQRRRQLGLPLQRFPDRAEDARGGHDLRARRDRASATGPARSTISAGRRRPIRSAWCTRRSTIPACRSTTRDRRAQLGRAQERAHPDPAAFRRHRAWRPRKPTVVNSMPPSYTGGNIDNWRIGKGATMYYPVAVPRRAAVGRRSARLAGRFGTLRHGDRMLADRHLPAHPAQGGRRSGGTPLAGARLSAARDPGRVGAARASAIANYLAGARREGAERRSTRNHRSTSRMRDAFRKMRRFLMTDQGAHRGRGDHR